MNMAVRMAEIRRQLMVSGKQVDHRALDIVIAATAIEHDLILVTRNARHFEDIETLRLWSTTSP
jgi:predicted nucleic acid-binding protein